ncbi:MAG TPA: SDR family oxidoreductase [Casimicrobiaceae bacterium]|nr:SDR family oxidoreductase [Casimicrobiaceae bacterium]
MTSPTFDSDLYSGQVALVVGGTSGIGAAIAEAFADLGAVVTVTGASRAECDAARSSPGFRCRDAIPLDVRDDAAVRALVDALPRLDALVNCAGIIRRGDEHDVSVFAEVLAINLTGTMRCCSVAREKLKASKGRIVNIASVLSFQGGGLVPGYSASKGGVAQLTKSLAIAYAADGIRVNAIAPGWVATAFTAALQNDAQRSAAIIARTPLARWARPEDIAGATMFLCSPAAAFITGAILPVDGGYLVT